jgi:hypothetical protein
MKKIVPCIIPLIMVFMVCASSGTAVAETNNNSAGMDMDAAIREAAAQMEAKIPAKTMVALVSVASPSTAFSTQVLTRLESAIVSSGKLVVVDRANLDKVREEQGFQLSGEVDDESAKSIGKLLGAGAIVTGSLVDLGDVYSLTLKAINIETATVAVSYLADLAKSVRVETLLASGGGATGMQTAQRGNAGGNAVAASVPESEPVVKDSYEIGEKGPAGGWIFYDKGNNDGGWRYLEAAPASTEGKDIQWASNEGNVQGTRIEIGSGKKNTQLIMEASVQTGENMAAARLCDRLRTGGYDDWFLPSKAELGLMYLNLKTEGIGGFSNDWYWSSSESPSIWGSYAWTQLFSNGTQTGVDFPVSGGGEWAGGKKKPHSVRAIRQF